MNKTLTMKLDGCIIINIRRMSKTEGEKDKNGTGDIETIINGFVGQCCLTCCFGSASAGEEEFPQDHVSALGGGDVSLPLPVCNRNAASCFVA